MKPRDAKTLKQICLLRTDNHNTKDYWIQLGEGNKVSLTRQRSGEQSTVKMWDIPKGQFNRLIDWYIKDQKA